VMLGQRIMPAHYHPFARTMSDAELAQALNGFHEQVSATVSKLPPQQEFISQYCKANSDVWG